MNHLNSILLEGNLIKDPVIKQTSKGICVCEFTIASNRFFKIGNECQKEISFFDIETWDKLAETCNEYLKKGCSIRIVGRLKQTRWKDNDGNSRVRVYIVADHVEFKEENKIEEVNLDG